MRARIHQPLWGGFPMHWAKGPAKRVKWTQEESKAKDYSASEIEAIKKQAKKLAPNAVFHAQ